MNAGKWVVILIGLVPEVYSIGNAIAEGKSGRSGNYGSTFLISLAAGAITALFFKIAFYETEYSSISFWLILIVLFAVPNILFLFARFHADAKAKSETIRLNSEDEKRIGAHIPLIKASRKYSAFKSFFDQYLSKIIEISVFSGLVEIKHSEKGIILIPDYNQGKMVLDKSRLSVHYFFGKEADERDWTVFEMEALARIVDEDVQATKYFKLMKSSNGFRLYSRIVPNERVIAKTPY